MGKLMKKYHYTVEVAFKIIEEEKLSWVEAIEKAKDIVEDEIMRSEISNTLQKENTLL